MEQISELEKRISELEELVQKLIDSLNAVGILGIAVNDKVTSLDVWKQAVDKKLNMLTSRKV
jgi:hypothetical protein